MISMTAVPTTVGGNSLPLGTRLTAMHALAQANTFEDALSVRPRAESVCRAYNVPLTLLDPPKTCTTSTLEVYRARILDAVRPKLDESIYQMRFAESVEAFRAADIPQVQALRAMAGARVISQEAADTLIDSAITFANAAMPLSRKFGLMLLGTGAFMGAGMLLKLILDGALQPWMRHGSSQIAENLFMISLGLIAGGALFAFTPPHDPSAKNMR